MNQRRKQNKKKKKSVAGWAVAAGILGLLHVLAAVGNGADAAIGGMVILLLVMGGFIAFVAAMVRLGNRRRSQSFQTPPPVPQPYTPSPAPAQTRTAPAQAQTLRSAPQQGFPVPEAHCVVCENTGEDHFQRDKVRRIGQLDDWLKNGLIDRSEYAELRDRYERGI